MEESAITRLMESPKLTLVKEYLFKKHSLLLYKEYVNVKKKLSEFEFNERNLLRSAIKYLYKWIMKIFKKVINFIQMTIFGQ